MPAMMKIFVARFDSRTLPVANSASVTPKTSAVPSSACRMMPGWLSPTCTYQEMAPTARPWKAA